MINIRQVTEVDENCIAKVVQINNYYPFGMQYCDGTVDDSDQNHKYNGKEYDNMHGLNTYDYGARQYYAALPIWDRVDPLCEKDYGTSPYVYCLNDPIKHIDPDGKKVVLFGTKLPEDVNSEHPWLHIIAGSATHTFVAVIDDKTNKLNGYISNYIKSVCTMFLLDSLIVSIGIIVLNIIFRLNKKDI